MPLPPIVTGLSPKEGPPGTRVTIRGENLGKSPYDLIALTICGSDCLLSAEWNSTNKIIARSGPSKARGDIIVTTLSGGKGTSTVQFRGYHDPVHPLKESAVWVDESHVCNFFWNRNRPMSPSSYQPDDPLELSVEGNEKKFPEDELHELFSEGSGNIRSENFVAAWFLLENHHTTSFNDLKAGLSSLQRKVSVQKEGQISFLKSNVGPVIDQLDTLVALNEAVEKNKKSNGANPTAKLEEKVILAKQEADKLFQEVLRRKDRADATRNALGILQRYRFLFSLPANIERNVQKGEYDAVINDYTRAKTLFENLDIQIFQKVYDEVELKINSLRDILTVKLQEMPGLLEDQKRLIRSLVNLDTPGDQAWECILYQYNYIKRIFLSCRDDHLSADQKSEHQGKTPNKVFNAPISTTLAKPNSHQNNIDLQISAPQRVLFLEELTDLIATSFPGLWKLGQAYFMGELHSKIDFGKQPEFKSMVINVVQLFSNLIRAAIVPDTLLDNDDFGHWPKETEDALTAWLTQSLRLLRLANNSLISLDLPQEVLGIAQELIFDIRVHSMTMLFKEAAEDIKTFHKKELWELEIEDEHGTITNLPVLFENSVRDTVQLVREAIVQCEKKEYDLLTKPTVQSDIAILVQSLLVAFAHTLDSLAAINTKLGVNSPQMVTSHNDSTPPRDIRLLILLNNCNYAINHTLPHLKELITKLGYPNINKAFDNANTTFKTLDRKLFNAYVELKCEPLVGTLEPSMYMGSFDWETCLGMTGVRHYIRKLIVDMVVIHAEIVEVSPMLVDRIMPIVVETVIEEYHRLLQCNIKFNQHGITQARLDTMAIQEAVGDYVSLKARQLLRELILQIPKYEDRSTDEKIVKEAFEEFKNQSKFHLMCLKRKEDEVTFPKPV